MLLLDLALLTAALLPPAAGEEGRWRDLLLLEGTYYDMERGELSSRAEGLEGGYLTLRGDVLVASPPLRVIDRPPSLGPGWSFRRDEGRTATELAPMPGAEYLFDGGKAWGYLRVLRILDEGVELELARAAPESTVLERDPYWLEAQSTPAGIELSWRTSEGGAGDFLVWRSELDGSGQEPRSSLLARTSELRYVDARPPEHLLEYRVARAGADGESPASLGNRARIVRVVRPAEWPLELESGQTIDLLSGAVGVPTAQLEILRAGPQSVQVRPLGGCALSQPYGPGPVYGWSLPGSYDPVMRALPLGGELVAALPEGAYVRLLFLPGEGEQARLVRQLDLAGRRFLPRAPGLPELAWRAGAVVLEFPEPLATPSELEHAFVVVEREREYGSDDWRELLAEPASRREVVVPEAGADELVRYRYRHRTTDGLASLPTAPQRVVLGDLADPVARARWIERALDHLTDPDWRRRREAGEWIELLGSEALERVVELLRSPDPELAAAARALLVESGGASTPAHVQAILEARALIEGVALPCPAELASPDVVLRLAAVLRCARADARSSELGWLRVDALADPDPALRAFANLLLESAPLRAPTANGVPWALLPSTARARLEEPALAQLLAGGADARVLAASLEGAADLDHPREALVTFAVAARLEQGLRPLPDPHMGRSDLEIALDLIDRHRRDPVPVLLDAAEQLVATPRVQLLAHEHLARERLDQVPSASLGDGLGRDRIVLPEPDYEMLADSLASWKGGEGRALDLVLPAGEYRPSLGRSADLLQIGGDGLRVLAQGEVRIAATLRVQDARDVVLDGLTIEREEGLALIVVGSSLCLRNCRLLAGESTINAQSSFLELDRTQLRPSIPERGSNFSIRCGGESFLLVRDSVLDSGGILNTGEGTLCYLECSLVDGRDRYAFQMQRACEVVARDCLLRGRQGVFFGPGKVLLEGGVLASEGTLTQAGDGGVRYCPDHLHLLGPSTDLGNARAFERCPLE